MQLWRCMWCKKKIESNGFPKKCPKCGTEERRVVKYPKHRSKSGGNRYEKTFVEPVAFHLVGELKK